MKPVDLLIMFFIFLVGVGVPVIVSYKFKTNIGLAALWFSLIVFWLIPEFSTASIIAYGVSLGVLIILGENHKKELDLKATMTPEELAEYNKRKHDEAMALLNEGNEKNEDNNLLICPNCSSSDVEFLGNNKKGFSVGKAVAGGLLTGGIGTLAGFAGKKGKSDRWHCKNCGNLFDK